MTQTATPIQRLRERLAQLREARATVERDDEKIIAANADDMLAQLDANNEKREHLRRQMLACEIALATALDRQAEDSAADHAAQLAKAEKQLRATAAERVELATDIGKLIAELRLAVLRFDECDHRAHLQGQRFCRCGPFATLRAPQKLFTELQQLLERQDIPDPIR